MYEGVLEDNGLSVKILQELSFKSKLGLSLNRNLHYFDKDMLLQELNEMTEWLDEQETLANIALDYRIKSIESIEGKYARYYPNRKARQVFNDILGFRAFCNSYDDVLNFDSEFFHVADLSHGKAKDDGYRGVHVYFQMDNYHYPIEIQFNTFYDRQINNWLHDYLYKKTYSDSIGCLMRAKYEQGLIHSDKDFEEVLRDVLSCC